MSVASKNLYDLLGNDAEDDTPQGPVKTVDKATTRTTKRNAGDEIPAAKATQAPARSRGGFSGNEGAYRDRGAGSSNNRLKTTDEAPQGARGGRAARERGGRGGSFRSNRDDRHSKTAPGGGSDKQANQSWGAAEGAAEMKDEDAGEAIAKKDEKDAAAEDAAEIEEPAEPEDKSVSYADYLAQQAEKKLSLENESNLKVRQANEGSKQNKQWASAKELVKDENEEFISGSGGKTKRERERKTKNIVDIDHQFVEPERTRGGGDFRGGRGGGRGRGEGGRGRGEGGRGRGEGFRGGRGGRGDGFRGGPRGGGDFRGGRGGGAPRGGQSGGSLNPSDEKAFPSLGS